MDNPVGTGEEALNSCSQPRHLWRGPNYHQTPSKSWAKSGGPEGVEEASRRSVWRPTILQRHESWAQSTGGHLSWRCANDLSCQAREPGSEWL